MNMNILETRRGGWLIAAMLVSALLLAACGGAATTAAPSVTEEAPESPTTAPTQSEETSDQPSVTVSDQELEAGTVTVDSVTAAGAGWMVIHADADGAPGPVIGHAAVAAGVNENVTVEVDTERVTATLYAMLHVDTGTEGEYEFPDADGPVRVDDQVVVRPFALSQPTSQSSGTIVATAAADPGTILVGSESMSLYLLTADSPGESTCAADCATAWPPLTTEGEPQAGAGVEAALLGTLTREDGSNQVTYNGWPLYYFADDANPGDTNGQDLQGSGGIWYVVGADGNPIEGSSGSADNGGDNGEDVDDLY